MLPKSFLVGPFSCCQLLFREELRGKRPDAHLAHKCVDIKDEDVHTHYVMIFMVNHNAEIIKGKNIIHYTFTLLGT